MKADLRHGGAIAHRAIKTVQGAKKEWTPPTRTVKLENGTLSSNPQDVQGEFVRQWAEKVFRTNRTKPSWNMFYEKFSEHIPKVEYTGGTPSGEDLYKTIRKMKLTVPGLDGWRVLELKQLPKAAWDERARVLEIGAETGKVPESYTHVGTPMMAKVKYTDEAMQHRGLAIFSVLYRIESSAWYEKLKAWQDGWIHPNVHGARGGHETLSSAWPAQSRIEAAYCTTRTAVLPRSTTQFV